MPLYLRTLVATAVRIGAQSLRGLFGPHG
jgi:hypothetical protein